MILVVVVVGIGSFADEAENALTVDTILPHPLVALCADGRLGCIAWICRECTTSSIQGGDFYW